jgi:hypothetical protein
VELFLLSWWGAWVVLKARNDVEQDG